MWDLVVGSGRSDRRFYNSSLTHNDDRGIQKMGKRIRQVLRIILADQSKSIVPVGSLSHCGEIARGVQRSSNRHRTTPRRKPTSLPCNLRDDSTRVIDFYGQKHAEIATAGIR